MREKNDKQIEHEKKMFGRVPMDNTILTNAELAHHTIRESHYNLQTSINYIDLRIKDGENFSLFDMQYLENNLRDYKKDLIKMEDYIKKILTKEMLNEHNKSIDRT